MADDNYLLEHKNPIFVNNDGDKCEKGDTPQEGTVALKRQVGIIGCVAMLVGTIIGSGIFSSPSAVMKNVNSVGATLIIWVVCGVFAMLSSLAYCELGSMYPNSSGAEYTYLLQAFGPVPAFLFSFTSTIVIKPSSLSIIALVCGKYIMVAIEGEDVNWISKLIAVGVILIVMVINCISVKGATITQVIFTAAKLIPVIMISVTGFVRLGQSHDQQFENSFNNTATEVSKYGYAMYQGLWAYDGWNTLNFLTEEMENPIVDLPRSIMIGIPFITACYVVMNIAYLTVLTPMQLAVSDAVAVDFADKMYGVMKWSIPVLVSCSTFGASNGAVFVSGRLVYVAAKNGHLPKLLAMIHKTRFTPIPAIVFTCLIAIIMLIPESSTFEELVNYFSFASWFFYGATFAALLWLRYKKPDLKRPYKVFIGVPVLCLLFSIYLVVAPFCDYPLKSFFCLLFILSGLLVYLMFIRFKAVKQIYELMTDKIEVWANLALPANEDGTDCQLEQIGSDACA